MKQSKIASGNPVIFDGSCGLRTEDFGLENDKIYRATDVEVVPVRTLLPAGYIEVGFISRAVCSAHESWNYNHKP